MSKCTKILIIRLSAIGDTIHTLPLAYALRKQFPDAQIDWLVEDKAAHFIKNNPLINKVHVFPRAEWKKRGISLKNFDEFNKLITDLRRQKYDIAIDTQQLFKSAIFLRLSLAKRRIALSGGREFSNLFANEIVPASHKLFDADYHIVNRHLELAQYLGCETDEIKFVLPPEDAGIKKHVDNLLAPLRKNLPILVLAPATTWETKHWQNKYWAEIIKAFEDKVNVVITGSPADKDLVDDILLFGNFKNVLNLTGKTNLNELSAVFKRSDVVVAPDSGSAQLAWACEKPFVVSIFTSTSKNRTAPFGENTKVFSPEIACYPCHKKKCFSKDFELCKNDVKYYDIIKFLEKLFK